MILQLALALRDLHRLNITHRDVKLENVFLSRSFEGEWKARLGKAYPANKQKKVFLLGVCNLLSKFFPEKMGFSELIARIVL